MTDDKLQKDVERGNRAHRIINDELMLEARKHIDDEMLRLFRSCAPTDTEALIQIKSMQYFGDKFFAFMDRCIKEGRHASFEIERKRKSMKDRVKGLIG